MECGESIPENFEVHEINKIGSGLYFSTDETGASRRKELDESWAILLQLIVNFFALED